MSGRRRGTRFPEVRVVCFHVLPAALGASKPSFSRSLSGERVSGTDEAVGESRAFVRKGGTDSEPQRPVGRHPRGDFTIVLPVL